MGRYKIGKKIANGAFGQLRSGLASSGWVWPAQVGFGQLRLGLASSGWVWPAQVGFGLLKSGYASSSRVWPAQVGFGGSGIVKKIVRGCTVAIITECWPYMYVKIFLYLAENFVA